MARVFITRRSSKDSSGVFARGKRAIAIDERTGFKKPYTEMVFEPGTNFFVHKSEDDGLSSLVAHPQNYPPDKLTDRIALKWAHADVFVCLSPIVSADRLGQGVPVSTGTGVSAGTSVGVGASGGRLEFDQAANSGYYILIFQGI